MPILSAGQRHKITVTLNGEERTGHAEPRMLLSDFLRHELGATGTHVGCEHGVCGACTIKLDGQPTRSCLTLAVQVDGSQLETVEASARRMVHLGFCKTAFDAISHFNAASAQLVF